MSSTAAPGNDSDELRQMFASAIKKNTSYKVEMDPYIIAYLLGRPTMSFALHLAGRKINLRHIKGKSCITILINSIRAVTYVLHCILLATGQKKIF